jgi:hypothetical protein
MAAKVWSVSVDHVLSCIGENSIATRMEDGYLLVDAAADESRAAAQRKSRLSPTPEPALAPAAPPPVAATAEPPAVANANEESDSRLDLCHWRRIRRETSALRRPPRLKPATAATVPNPLN